MFKILNIKSVALIVDSSREVKIKESAPSDPTKISLPLPPIISSFPDLKVTKRDIEKERKQKIREEQNLQALIYTNQIINNDKYAQRELDQLINEAGNLKSPKESIDFNNKLLLLLIAEIRQEKMLKAIEIRNNIAKNMMELPII